MKKALIVGIDNYQSAPLSGCVNDANSMANVLEVNGDGSPNFSVRLLTASTNQLLKRELKQQVEELFSGDNETSLFYFAGHGCLTPIGGYIVTSDGVSYDEGISMNEILMYANKSKAKNKIIILDCCHSGALGKLPDIQEDRSLLGLGLIVLTACRDSETSAEIGGRGIFTSLVEDALQGGAADLRGFVTPGSIYSYVDQALGPWDQRPIFKSNVTAFTSLRKINPPLATEELRKICTLFTNPSEEYDNAIELYKKEQAKLGLANALKALGELESRLGNVDLARGHYDNAIELYKKEQDQLGLANAYQSYGDLLLASDHIDQALPYYQDALSLYRSEQEPMGHAYVLAEIIRCRFRLGRLTMSELEIHAHEVLTQADKSGAESVIGYVLNALYEACDSDKEQLTALLKVKLNGAASQ